MERFGIQFDSEAGDILVGRVNNRNRTWRRKPNKGADNEKGTVDAMVAVADLLRSKGVDIGVGLIGMEVRDHSGEPLFTLFVQDEKSGESE